MAYYEKYPLVVLNLISRVTHIFMYEENMIFFFLITFEKYAI
jgi:hypothetical protein